MPLSTYHHPDALPVSLEASPLESNRFGLRLGRLSLARAEAPDVEAVVALVDASDLDMVVLRYPAERVGWFAALAERYPRVIYADTLSYWGAALDALTPPPVSRFSIGLASPGDDLAPLVRRVFADHPTHYNANPRLAGAGVVEGYAEWAAAYVGCPGRAALLARGGDTTVGLCTVDLGEDAEVALIGVDPDHRRLGLASDMMHAAAEAARRAGGARLIISTQAANVPVQRVWARLGLLPERAFTTVHVHLTEDR